MDNQQVSNYLIKHLKLDDIPLTRYETIDDVKFIVNNRNLNNKEIGEKLSKTPEVVKKLRRKIYKNIKGLIPDGFTKIDNHYLLSKDGTILSTKTYREIKTHPNRKGYLVFDRAHVSTVSVHRLVAKTFIPNPENKPQVNHIDGNKQNNHVDNLEWVTQEENIEHAKKHNLYDTIKNKKRAYGIKNNMSKLKNGNIVAIRSLSKCLTHTEIAEIYNVSRAMVSCIVNGKNWKHIK